MGFENKTAPNGTDTDKTKKEVSDYSETSRGGSRGSRTPDPLLVRQML